MQLQICCIRYIECKDLWSGTFKRILVMEGMSSIQQLKRIDEALQREKKVNLFGPPGVGKTWMAKRVSDRSTRNKSFDFTLWAFTCRDYNIQSLSESMAHQLCLLPTIEEWVVEDDSNGIRVSDGVEIPETLIEKIRKKLEGKKILIVLDDVMDDETKRKENEEKFWLAWTEMLSGYEKDIKLQTVLISRSRREEDDLFKVEVEALPRADSYSLLKQKLDPVLRESPGILTLGKKFIEKGNNLPGAVTMIAKALISYFGLEPSGVSMLERELEGASEKYSVNKLLCRKHKVLPIGVLKDLCWDGLHFFRDNGGVHYNELITYWILEGYLGFGSMTELYEKGHRILMELMDCGILKEQEGGYVFMDKSLLNVDDLYQCLDQIASLGLATVFTSDIDGFGRITHDDGMLKTPWTSNKGKNQERKQSLKEAAQNLSTLLLDGTHFNEDVLVDFLESEKELQVLALFNPTIKSLPKPLAMMGRLRVLVLRGCVFLEEFNIPLKALRVLEISGARSLNELKPEFFNDMTKLQSLNLSELPITSLPESIYSLAGLQWLVIKDCPHLKGVKKLAKLTHLMVLDLSGNISLDHVNKNFLEFKNLRSLNLANTMISTTPLLRNVKKLTHLLLRDCKNLGRVRSLALLTSLQTIDLSGSTNFEEFHDPSLGNLASLRTLDLSGTTLDCLPSNIANPRYLYLKSCLRLEQLIFINSLVDLEVLDLSGSKNLKEIEDDFFDKMACLRVLNLSEANVQILPSLSNLSNLRELLLSRCASLVELPSLEFVTKLEVLDVSHCGALEDIGNPSFGSMTHLQKLDLSETNIKYLPALSNPSNLRQLLLKNCTALQNLELNVSLLNLEVLNLAGITSLAPNGAELVKDMCNLQILDLSCTPLQQLPSMANIKKLSHLSLAGCTCLETVPDLDSLTTLEVLDLSGSAIKRLPNFSSSNNLRKLLLKDCVMAEDVPDVEVNDLLGPTLKIPHEISALCHLDYLELPNIKDIQGVERYHVGCSSEEMNQDQWNICRLSDDDKPPLFFSGTQFLQILKKSPSPKGTFHLCAFPVTVEGETGDRYLQRRELVFADVYLRTSQFAQYKGNRSLQIRGFNNSPKGIENVIGHVNLLLLIDNKFNSLLSGVSVSVLSELKGCWIERCDEMISIFYEKEMEDDPKSGIALENLGISNIRRLTSIYNGKRPFGILHNLKTLYLDGCPELSTLFPSSWLPKTLTVLQIKYCDKIVSLSEADGELPCLETLYLWELPELKRIGFSFPSLQTLKIRSCEKLQTLFAHSNSVDNELACLNTLHLEDLPLLKSIGFTLPSLRKSRVSECPNLQFDGIIGHQN